VSANLLKEALRSVSARGVCVLATAIAVIVFCLPMFSQVSQGIQGAVLDQSGGAIPGAVVTVIDVARGITRTLTTDSAGEYVATNLTPATYTVRAAAKGFRTVEHSGVLLEVGENIRVDLVVQPGEQTQTITVTGEVPAIDTTDATLGGAVSNNSINSLPLNGRNFFRLLELRPGVLMSQGQSTGSSSTNGRRAGGDLLLVEGIPSLDQAFGGSTLNAAYKGADTASLVPIDAIQEFSTQQNPKAEFGWRDGGVVSVGVKSGTNSLHGTAYAFGRNGAATDAANYFTGAVTPGTVEQFGATVGGRIVKDKVFWFASYEGLRTYLGSVAVVTIPSDVGTGTVLTAANVTNSANMVDICNFLKTPGNAVGTVSPLSARLAGLGNFATGSAGSCTVTPSSSTFENVFPYASVASTAGVNFLPGIPSAGPLNNGLIKGDWNLSSHHHLNGMYFVSEAYQVQAAGILPQWNTNIPIDTRTYDGNWTWTPTSTLVNDVRMGYSYVNDQTLFGDANLLPSNPWPNGYGLPTGVTNPKYGGFPTVTISNITAGLGNGGRSGRRGPDGTVDFKDAVSYLRGKHTFKFGFEYADVVLDQDEYANAQGTLKFNSLQAFLAGNVNGAGSVTAGESDVVNTRQHWFAGFAQDDWRVTSRVTLNLGLRYEYFTSPTDRNNYMGEFNPNVNPATTPAVQQAGPGEPLSLWQHPQKDLFSPRFGFAWDVRGNGKTVVRAGASVLTGMVTISEMDVPFQPFGASIPSIGLNNAGTDANAHTPLALSLTAAQLNAGWNLLGPVFPITNGATCTVAAPCSTSTLEPNFRVPRSAQWNLDIQRAITNNLTLDVAYVGNHGFDEQYLTDLNNPSVGAGWDAKAVSNCLASTPLYNNCTPDTTAETGQYSNIFPYLKYIIQSTNGAVSNYNALQVTGNQRLSHGLSFLAGYTYAHALDFTSNVSQGHLLPTDPSNINLDYGNSNNDLRHRVTFSPTYMIPGMKSPAQMLEGWSLSGILIAQSGTPWFPDDVTADDFLGTGENRDRFQTTNTGVVQPWNYTGPTSAFRETQKPIPCYGNIGGCTPYSVAGPAIQTSCQNAAQAPYAGNAQLQQLAVAALTNSICYMEDGGILTPPAYGTVGNEARNLFTGQRYYNVDLSIQKAWTWKERYSAQFRLETFNLLNRADFSAPKSTDPSVGIGGGFGQAMTTADNGNSILGSGGPRHIQFALKLIF
jgi:hypothetical protein